MEERNGGKEGGKGGASSTWLEGAVPHDQDVEGVPVLTQSLGDEAWEGRRAGERGGTERKRVSQ